MSRTIYIPYETKNREFDGKLLLISNLLNKFSKVLLGSRKDVKREALNSYNGIYILKSLAHSELEFYKTLKRRGFVIILIHAEGGIHYKDNTENILSAFNKEAMQYIDYNFVFGKAIFESIRKFMSTDSSTISGEPRFDLLKPKYREIFKPDMDAIKNKFGKFILINTNFGLANPFVGLTQLLSFYEKDNNLTENAKKLHFEKLEFQKGIVESYQAIIAKCAEEFKDINFVIRPHPSESFKIYEELAAKHSNVFVSSEGNVVQWILASEAVIHYDCTTGMEAALAKKPVISYIPEINQSVLAWLPVELSYKAKTWEDLKKGIEHISDFDSIHSIESDIYTSWKDLINNVEEESCPIIMKEILSSIDTFPKVRERRASLKQLIQLQYLRKRTDLKVFKDNLKGTKSITREKFGVLSIPEVEQKLKIMNGLNNFNHNVKIKRITKDLISLEKR